MADEIIWRDYELDERSNEELIAAALRLDRESKNTEYHDVVTTFVYRGTWEALEMARKLSKSENLRERLLGVDMLVQLIQNALISDDLENYRQRLTEKFADLRAKGQGLYNSIVPEEEREPYLDAISETLFALLETETDPSILAAIATASGKLHDFNHRTRELPRIIPALVQLSTHPDENVRFSVAVALEGIRDERAYHTLIHLMTDPDEDVRDWATFGLGSQTEADSEEIRAALRSRLTDDNLYVQGEALVGLARRGDACAVETLLNLAPLQAGTMDEEALFEACKTTRDPRLLPLLYQLQESERWQAYFTDEYSSSEYQQMREREMEVAIAYCQGDANHPEGE